MTPPHPLGEYIYEKVVWAYDTITTSLLNAY